MYTIQPGKELRYYQASLIDETIRALGTYDSVCSQLSTGGGKTVIASAIAARFLSRNPDATVIITFHEHSLLRSMRKTLYDFFGIIASVLDADTNTLRPAKVYVCMAMTLQNRLKLSSYQQLFSKTGLLMCDEVHRGEHRDIEAYFKGKCPLSDQPLFPKLKYVGFTATPKNATPKDPLKNHYQEIVVGVGIKELIGWNQTHPAEGLVQNLTYSLKTELQRKDFKLNSRGEFDDTFQGNVLKAPKYISAVLKEYKDRCFGLKTIVFNSSIEHSQAVDIAFSEDGLPSRHLDGKNWPRDRKESIDRYSRTFRNYDEWRLDCLKWFKDTDGAILHNCGVLGTGFDETSVEANIVNKFVNSMPYWIQILGRSGRPHRYKDGTYKRFHIHIDMYGNAGTLKDWSEDRPWKEIFHKPKMPSDGLAPVKSCPECSFINPASIRVCKGETKGEFHNPPRTIDMIPCGYIFPEKEVAEEKPLELKLITKGVNVKDVIAKLEQYGIAGGKYGALKEMIRHNARKLRNETDIIDGKIAEGLLVLSIVQTKEYCHLNGMNCTPFFKNITKVVLYTELKKLFPDFEYEPPAQRVYVNPQEA